MESLFQQGLREARPRRQELDLRLIPLGFAAVIAVGAALLAMPWTHQPGKPIGTLDAVFLATSATCVTGLVTVNVGETFNTFGHLVLLVLMQTGGIGIVTAGMLLALAAGRRLSLADEQTIRATLGRLREARPKDVFIYSCVFVLLLELAGAVALFVAMNRAEPGREPVQVAWEALFHAVSAFCNAGISTYPEGMMRWRHAPGVVVFVSLLVIAGGIGLLTLINLRYYYFWRRDPRRRGRLTLSTRICLAAALFLLVVGTVAVWAFEWGDTLKGLPWSEQLLWAFFHSCSAHTAGFNLVDVGNMNPATLLITIALMFIGGAPGSMAGGVKTVTVVVLLLTAWSALRRRDEIECWGRRLPPRVSFIATMVLLFAGLTIVTGVGLLMLTENQQPASQSAHGWLGIVFEAVSAFCTVGLSTGVTPLLTAPGKVIIIALMFTGRLAPLLLALYLARPPARRPVRPPVEEVALG
ncbi:MAG: TrkH family potassium uptake protein [Limisphaerales bacterium]|jgi:trk system potassium uptake protein TrkH